MKHLLLSFLALTLSFSAIGSGITSFDGPSPFPLDVSIYPNPSNGVFNLSIIGVKNESAQVTVTNLIGQVIAEYRSDVDFSTSFDLSNAPRGVYFLIVQCGEKQTMKRLVLQ